MITKSGKIEAIIGEDERLRGAERIEANQNSFLLPAAIDCHCHFRVGDSPPREGFASGSRAALAGGIGTVLEHPQGSPTVVDPQTLIAKAERGRNESILDFGLWVGAIPGNNVDLNDALAAGACGVKAFLCHGNPQFPPVGQDELLLAMEVAARYGRVVAVHAEWQPTLDERQTDGVTYRDWMRSRPIRAEVEAVDAACRLAGRAGARLHLVHLSSRSAVRRGLAWRRKGVDVTVETCPHYLFLDSRDAKALGPFAKCMPPLRTPAQRLSLLTQLEEGIDTIGSDHAPHRLEERALGLRHYADAPSGLATNQFMLMCVATALCRRMGSKNGLRRLAEMTASTPARHFGLTDRGSLAAGKAADFVIIRRSKRRLLASQMYSRIRYTPFHGLAVDFAIDKVIIGGEIAFSAADGIVREAAGRWLRWPRAGSPRTSS